MPKPLVCMTLTGRTLKEDYALVKQYEKQIDLVELRADYLDEDEQLYIKRFPALINLPCILSIRRDIDGGKFSGGEFSRTNLFGRALAFANPDKSRNYAYVDFEEDYQVPSIQDAALAFGVKIIRSCYDIEGSVNSIRQKSDSMRKTGYEIPKIEFNPASLTEVATLFKETETMSKYDHIVTATGLQGQPSRLLSSFTGSYLTYVSPIELLDDTANAGYFDCNTFVNAYNFRNLSRDTKLIGITGWPLAQSPLVEILNAGFKKKQLDAISMPLRTPSITDSLYFAEQLGFSGMVVNEPFIQSIIYYLTESSNEVTQIGTCNTIVRRNSKWAGFNTDAFGFQRALTEFLAGEKIKRKKVAIIGAGGSARTAAYILHQLGAKVCIFNRTLEHAQVLADKYNFKCSNLEPSSAPILDEYSSLIIQTTTVGSNTEKEEDPISFYKFRGDELLFDLVYSQATTPLMRRAAQSGCRTSNGRKMLEYSAHQQFKLFTGDNYIS